MTAALPVAVVNPRHARDFAKGAGKLAKTDALGMWTVTENAPSILFRRFGSLLHRR
jgi:transposase